MCVTVHLHEITENYKNRPNLYSVLLPEISIENIESQTSAFQLQYFRIIPIGTADCAFDSYSPQDGSEFQNSKLLKSKKKKIFFQRKKYNHLKSFIFRFLRAVMSVPTCKLFHPTSGPSFQFFFKRFEIAIQLNLSFSPTTSRQGISLTKVWNMLFFISQLVLLCYFLFVKHIIISTYTEEMAMLFHPLQYRAQNQSQEHVVFYHMGVTVGIQVQVLAVCNITNIPRAHSVTASKHHQIQ